jgi:hypothetical protein
MSKRKSKFQEMRERKDQRAKKFAIGGAVLLVAVLAFEIPHVLKKSGGTSATPPPATTATTATTTGSTTPAPATTPPGTAAAAVTPTGSTQLPNDAAPKRSKSQLYSFSNFKGKDPFAQQVVDATQTPGDAPSTSTGGTSGASSGVITAASPSIPATTAATSQQTQARTLAQTGSATISVNGRAQVIRIGASFPSSNPLFKLVSIANGIARVGIAGGSYASGASTVSLTAGRTLTLVDTADGVRYKLQLVSAS